MSIATWKDEFYPEPVKFIYEFKESTAQQDVLAPLPTWKEMVEQSLRKWRGLTKDNLLRHECYLAVLYPSPAYVVPVVCVADWTTEDAVPLDQSTCGLCAKSNNITRGFNMCRVCPLDRHLGAPCDSNGQPFEVFFTSYNPSDMIKALEELLGMELDQ